eukprot:scaffold90982_cov33-Attheya_sp.AAC.1
MVGQSAANSFLTASDRQFSPANVTNSSSGAWNRALSRTLGLGVCFVAPVPPPFDVNQLTYVLPLLLVSPTLGVSAGIGGAMSRM